MSKKKNEIEVIITCNSKEELRAIAEAVRGAIINGELAIEKDDSNEPEPKAFQPKEGDICTYIECEDDPTAIFRFNGKEHVNEDGIRILESELSVEYSGNLLRPYIVIRGEGQEVPADDCRLATEEEINLFNEKVKECEKYKNADWMPKKDETFWSPARDHFVGCVFVPGKVEWVGDELDHRLLKKGWVFRTKEECQPLCDKLNEAIENVKP